MANSRGLNEKDGDSRSGRVGGACVRPGEKTMPYPRVCAHQGFNTIAPANSLPAWGAAVALGAEEIEFDLRETADGVPVSIHNATLERVSNGVGPVREKTLAELEALDFGCKSPERFGGLRVVKFADILRAFSKKTVMNIHLKSESKEKFSREFVRKVADMLVEYDCASYAYFMGSPDVMEAAIEVAEWIPRCMGAGPQMEKMEIVDRAITWKCCKIQLFKPYYTQAMIDRAHGLGMRCNFFHSEDPAEARRLFEMGIDTILTNDYWNIAKVKEEFVR